jgi:hypothetical protein
LFAVTATAQGLMRHVDLSWPDMVSAEMTLAEVRAAVAAGSAAAFSQAFGCGGASHEYCCLVRRVGTKSPAKGFGADPSSRSRDFFLIFVSGRREWRIFR